MVVLDFFFVYMKKKKKNETFSCSNNGPYHHRDVRMIVVVVGKLDHNHPSLLRLRGNLLPARMEDSSLLHRGRTEGTAAEHEHHEKCIFEMHDVCVCVSFTGYGCSYFFFVPCSSKKSAKGDPVGHFPLQTMTRRVLARVRATVSLRSSSQNPIPVVPSRTVERTTVSASRPWKESTVWTSLPVERERMLCTWPM